MNKLLKNMKLILLLINISLILNTSAQNLSSLLKKSKENYKISATIKNATEGDTLVFGFYKTTFSSAGTFAKDTAVIKNSKVTFKGEELLEEGMYFLFDKKQENIFIPLLITKQNLNFIFDIKDINNTLRFTDSPINSTALEYQKFLQSKSEERKRIMNSNLSEKEIKEETLRMNNEITEYRDITIQNNLNNFFGMFLKTTSQIIIPESIANSPEAAIYYRNHYWDNFKLDDNRILNTSSFYNTLNDYFEKWTYKNPDSIINSINIITEKANENKKMLEFFIEFSFYKWEKEWKKIMGMDKILVHIADNYIQQNLCTWMDSTRKADILERAEKISPNLIGKKAAEFLDFYGRPFMKDIKGTTYTLQGIDAKYTLLVFYGPTCGHCKKEMPKVKKEIDSLNVSGVNIKTFAVATEFDKEEWQKFIKEQNITDWTNVADINHDQEGNPVASSDWRDKYDIYSTPVIYLLDKNKTILAKRINYKQISEIISRQEKK